MSLSDIARAHPFAGEWIAVAEGEYLNYHIANILAARNAAEDDAVRAIQCPTCEKYVPANRKHCLGCGANLSAPPPTRLAKLLFPPSGGTAQQVDPEAHQQSLERRIDALSEELTKGQEQVRQWVEASASLSIGAAQARAKNQSAGKGFLGAFLGSQFRGAMRRGAAASNAVIAQEVADKRANIAEGKRQAQDVVRQIREQLAEAKKELKELSSRARVHARSTPTKAKSTFKSLDLLKKLKQAHEDGLLTDAEYEEKRRKFVSDL